MNINLNGQSINFITVPLTFLEWDIADIFCDKNNRTLEQTLNHKRYKRITYIFEDKYSEFNHLKLGEFLRTLKNENNNDYTNFLNKYGDKKYCRFNINQYLTKRGIYCFAVDSHIKYIGRCLDSYDKRINKGYGRITSKNCFKDGQATNCRINSLINSLRDVQFGVYPMTSSTDEIKLMEREILIHPNFSWNIH